MVQDILGGVAKYDIRSGIASKDLYAGGDWEAAPDGAVLNYRSYDGCGRGVAGVKPTDVTEVVAGVSSFRYSADIDKEIKQIGDAVAGNYSYYSVSVSATKMLFKVKHRLPDVINIEDTDIRFMGTGAQGWLCSDFVGVPPNRYHIQNIGGGTDNVGPVPAINTWYYLGFYTNWTTNPDVSYYKTPTTDDSGAWVNPVTETGNGAAGAPTRFDFYIRSDAGNLTVYLDDIYLYTDVLNGSTGEDVF